MLSTPMIHWQKTMAYSLDYFQHSGKDLVCKDVLYYLAQYSGNWSVFEPWMGFIDTNTHDLYDLLSTMLGIENRNRCKLSHKFKSY